MSQNDILKQVIVKQLLGCAPGIMLIAIGNGHSNKSSKPG